MDPWAKSEKKFEANCQPSKWTPYSLAQYDNDTDLFNKAILRIWDHLVFKHFLVAE